MQLTVLLNLTFADLTLFRPLTSKMKWSEFTGLLLLCALVMLHPIDATSPSSELQQDALAAAYDLPHVLPEPDASSSSSNLVTASEPSVHATTLSNPLGSIGSFELTPATPSRNRSPWKLEKQQPPPTHEVTAQAFAAVSYSRVFVRNSCLTGGTASVSFSYVPPLTSGYHQVGYFQVHPGTMIYAVPTSNRYLYYNAYRNNHPSVGWGGSLSQYVPGRTGCAIRGMKEVDLGIMYADYVIELIC
jgi:hypothetical protein